MHVSAVIYSISFESLYMSQSNNSIDDIVYPNRGIILVLMVSHRLTRARASHYPNA
jgi:hypothetical protein